MRRLVICATVAFASACAHAAPFADPFKPPRELQPANTGKSANPPSALQLESVLIAPDRRVAVINGEQYTEGARLGDGRVLRISEAEVIVRRGDRDEALHLFPLRAKRPSGSAEEEK